VSLNVDTGLEQVVAQPDGLYWYYCPNRKEILHLNPGAGGPRPGTVLKAWSVAQGKDRVVAQIDYLASLLTVTSDGRRAAYVTYQPVEGSTAHVSELGVLDLDSGSRQVLVPTGPEAIAPMAWSADGRYLLCKPQTKAPLIMDVSTRESWPLCANASDAAFCADIDNVASWSPDGRFIVLCRGEKARVERLAWEGVTAEAVAKLMRRR